MAAESARRLIKEDRRRLLAGLGWLDLVTGEASTLPEAMPVELAPVVLFTVCLGVLSTVAKRRLGWVVPVSLLDEAPAVLEGR